MIAAPELAILSQLTYLAYKDDRDFVANLLKSGQSPFLRCYPHVQFLESLRLLSSPAKTSCCGFIVADVENNIVVAIRGTENLDEYFYNLLANPDPESNSIHSGFLTYVDNFWDQVRLTLENSESHHKNLYFVGHSLGGAAALILTKRAKDLGLFPESPWQAFTYTFGAPPVSTQELYIHHNIHHYRTEGDFIPHLPRSIASLIRKIPAIEKKINDAMPLFLSNLEKYSHHEQEYRWIIKHDASIVPDQMQADLQIVRRLARSLVTQNPLKAVNQIRKNSDSQGLFKTIINTVLGQSVQEHRAITYVKRLFPNQTPPSWISEIT
jgi:pimeloyl-ACP methyl ester carboxylesterase